MAYDKIIDSAQLDGALSATADAIRGKTGETAQIAWDATSGFANVISGISSGSQVAIGTFTVTATKAYDLNDGAITISGIGFTPSRVIAYNCANSTGSSTTAALSSFDLDSEFTFVDASRANMVANTSEYTASINTDGFTISAQADVSSPYVSTGTWRYIAIG